MKSLLEQLFGNWKTSLCGAVAVLSVFLWSFRVIDTNEFLSVMGFALGGGMMLASDRKIKK